MFNFLTRNQQPSSTLSTSLDILNAEMTEIPFADTFVYHLRNHLHATEQHTVAFNNILCQFSLALIELQKTHQALRQEEEKHSTALRQSEEKYSQLLQSYNDLHLRYCRSLDAETILQKEISDLQKETQMKEDAIEYLMKASDGENPTP